MKRIALLLIAVAMVSGVVTARAETPTLVSEPPATLIVDAPVMELLVQGIVWIPWRAENVNIGPVFWQGSPQHIPTGWTSAHTRGRPALVVGGLQY